MTDNERLDLERARQALSTRSIAAAVWLASRRTGTRAAGVTCRYKWLMAVRLSPTRAELDHSGSTSVFAFSLFGRFVLAHEALC